jgi:hypothetical protein
MIPVRRSVTFAAAILTVTLAACRTRAPDFSTTTPDPPSTPTPLPADFSLIPPFTPSYPCELQNVDAYDEQLCWNERVTETTVAQGDRILFIHEYHRGTGCWGTIHEDRRELRVCDTRSGQTTTLAGHVTSELVPSPDGEWFVFVVLDYGPHENDDDGLHPHVYRVRRNGTDLLRLDAAGLGPSTVGAAMPCWSPDGEWIELSLWDGTAEGWRWRRIKTDGSGVYEPLP